MRNTLKIGTLILFGSLLPKLALAQPGAAWSHLPAGARSAGLAGGMASLADGLQGSRLNPASLASVSGMQAEATHSQWLQGVNQEQGGVALNLGQGLGAAVAFEWLDMGEVTRYQPLAGGGYGAQGSWHPTAGALTLSLGSTLGSNLDAGVALRGWRQDLDGEGATAASGSAALRFKPSASTNVSLALVDMGTQLAGDNLPAALRLGAAWQVPSGQRVALEGASPLGSSGSIDWSAALESPLGSAITLRGGALLLAGNLNPMPTAGLSVAVSGWSLDFGYSAAGELGSTLHAGLSLITR
jgi:hypothetical protein